MTRTLSVAGALAILLFAYWLPYVTTGNYSAASTPLHSLDAPSSEPIAATEQTASAVDDLAAWPVAASR